MNRCHENDLRQFQTILVDASQQMGRGGSDSRFENDLYKNEEAVLYQNLRTLRNLRAPHQYPL
jgi:hypothetical protein